jgi:hypothetical protein
VCKHACAFGVCALHSSTLIFVLNYCAAESMSVGMHALLACVLAFVDFFCLK